jgi:hypothetical protein
MEQSSQPRLPWYSIHLPHTCVFHAVNAAFLNMLRTELHASGFPIYRTVPNDGDGYLYYFSPAAAERFRQFLEFWGGAVSNEPAKLECMRRIV